MVFSDHLWKTYNHWKWNKFQIFSVFSFRLALAENESSFTVFEEVYFPNVMPAIYNAEISVALISFFLAATVLKIFGVLMKRFFEEIEVSIENVISEILSKINCSDLVKWSSSLTKTILLFQILCPAYLDVALSFMANNIVSSWRPECAVQCITIYYWGV